MRKIALLLALLMLIVGMASCGTNDELDATDSTDTSLVVSESDSGTESSAITDAPSESERESAVDTKENWTHRY